MATSEQIAAALARAQAAGNAEAVAEISAMVPDDAPGAAQSNPASGPTEEQIRSALARAEADGNAEAVAEIKAMLPAGAAPQGFGDILKDAAIGTAQVAADNVPVLGAYADDAYAWARSKMTGEDEDRLRADYNKSLAEANSHLSPGARVALAVGGGAAGAKVLEKAAPGALKGLAKLWGVPGGIMLGGIEGYGRGEGEGRVGMGILGSALGGAMGPFATLAGKALGAGTGAVRKMMGDTDPFIDTLGRSGQRAKETVRSAIEDAQEAYPGATIDPSRPLVESPLVARAGNAVVKQGGQNAGKMMRAADETLVRAQDDLTGKINRLSTGVPRGDEARRIAGKGYSELTGGAIADFSASPGDLNKQIRKSPILGDSRFSRWLSNDPDIVPILKRQAESAQYRGTSPRNATRLHALQSELEEQIRAASSRSVKQLLIEKRGRILDELERVEGYTQARNQFSRTIMSNEAHEMGMKAGARVPDVSMWTVRDKQAYAEGLAVRLDAELSAPGLSPRVIIGRVNKYKPHLKAVLFDGDDKKMAAFEKALKEDVDRLAAAGHVRGSKLVPDAEREAGALAQFVSGSIPGVITRAAVASGAHMAEQAALKLNKAAASKITKALTEDDPEKIKRILKSLGADPVLESARRSLTFLAPAASAGPRALSEGYYDVGR